MLRRTSRLNLDPGFWTRTSWIQLAYGLWVNLAQLAIGLAFGFPAVQVPQLIKPGSTIQITNDEASWIASVLTLSSPIGCLISGFIIDKFGRKIMIIICQGPMCIGWLYTGLAHNSNHIIIGRAITGIGCGMAMGAPRIYCSEMSLPNMRGVIGTFPSIAVALGICMQAGLGVLFKWQILCYTCSVLTLLNFVLYNFIPETPYFLLMHGSFNTARKNLTSFRGPNYDFDAEMDQLIEFKIDNGIRKLDFPENISALFTRSSCKPFSIINTYVLITQLSGVNAILMWTIEILREANSSVDIYTGNFLLGLTRLFVTTITSVLLFKIGKKPLSLTSAAGVSMVCLALGSFLRYNDKPSPVPQLCFMAYMAFASLGYYTLPHLMMTEMYPLQVRGILSGITVSAYSMFLFGSTKLYPLVRDSAGFANTIIIFGINSLFGTLFLYLFLPETKELTLQEIEEYYNARRPSLVSQRRIISTQNLASRSSYNLKSSLDLSKYLEDVDGYSSDEIRKQLLRIKRLKRIEISPSSKTIGSSVDEYSTTSGSSNKSKTRVTIRDDATKSIVFGNEGSISEGIRIKHRHSVQRRDSMRAESLERRRSSILKKKESQISREYIQSSDMTGSEESTDSNSKLGEDEKRKLKRKRHEEENGIESSTEESDKAKPSTSKKEKHEHEAKPSTSEKEIHENEAEPNTTERGKHENEAEPNTTEKDDDKKQHI